MKQHPNRNRPKTDIDNKGVLPFKIGNKPYRVIITDREKGSQKSAKYFSSFEDAVNAYIIEHLKRYGCVPNCKYINPETGEIVFDFTGAANV